MWCLIVEYLSVDFFEWVQIKITRTISLCSNIFMHATTNMILIQTTKDECELLVFTSLPGRRMHAN
jgi:hypothetical protein